MTIKATMITIMFFDSAGFTLVGFIDADLFCTSKDLLESLRKENEAPFCTITGVVLLCIVHMWLVYSPC